MKAIVYEKYGDPCVLKPADIEMPLPKDHDVLIRVFASSVSAADWRLRRADPFLVRLFNGLFRPGRIKVLGFELSGVVVKTGRAVTRFAEGDEVYASTGFKFGTYAEFVVMDQDGMISRKPNNLSLLESAGIPVGANTALHYLNKMGNVERGQKILVYGASGSVGTYAVQMAKAMGAEVTGVCSSANVHMVESLGADNVYDYNSPDFKLPNNYFDLVLDAVGKTSRSNLKYAMKNTANFVSVKNGTARMNRENLEIIGSWVEKGAVKPVIDQVFPINEIRKAHDYVEKQHKKGNVILLVEDNFI